MATEARKRILMAAAEVVAHAGLHPWSMAAVAQRACVHRATLYRYFSSKSDLIDALPEAAPAGAPAPRIGPPATVAPGDTGPGRGRRRLIASARELFSQQGYDATRIREIAEHAEMSKVMIYRYFGSKANLFREATVDPFNQFITTYLDAGESNPDAASPIPERAMEFFAEFYSALQEHRDLLVALLWPNPGVNQPASHAYLERAARHWFSLLDEVMETDPARHEFRSFDRAIVNRLFLGMLLSVVVFDPWLMGDPPPSERELVKQMAEFTAFGIFGRPPPDRRSRVDAVR